MTVNLYIYTYSAILKKLNKTPQPKNRHHTRWLSDCNSLLAVPSLAISSSYTGSPKCHQEPRVAFWDWSPSTNLGSIVPFSCKEAPSRVATLAWCFCCPHFILLSPAGTVYRLKVTTLFWSVCNQHNVSQNRILRCCKQFPIYI